MTNALVANFLTNKLKAIEEEEASAAAMSSSQKKTGAGMTSMASTKQNAKLPSLIDAHSSSSTTEESRDGFSAVRDASLDTRTTSSMGASSTITAARDPTMDVHVCNSSACKLCAHNSKGVKFVSTQSIDGGAVGVLHYLLNHATWGTGYENHQDDERSINSFKSKNSKARQRKRSTKYVSGDGDD